MDNKRNECVKEFAYLWKTDDDTWLNERKEQWRYLEKHGFSEYSVGENKEYSQYFIYGVKKKYIDPITLYFLTPFTSADLARRIFESDLFEHGERNRILSDYIYVSVNYGLGVSWFRQHIQWFIEGALGNVYQVVQEKTSGGRLKTISPEPESWCNTYIFNAKRVLSNEVEYSGCVDAIEYFVSMLKYITNESLRAKNKIEGLISLVDEVLSKSDNAPIVQEFAQNLKKYESEIINNLNTISKD